MARSGRAGIGPSLFLSMNRRRQRQTGRRWREPTKLRSPEVAADRSRPRKIACPVSHKFTKLMGSLTSHYDMLRFGRIR